MIDDTVDERDTVTGETVDDVTASNVLMTLDTVVVLDDDDDGEDDTG